MNATGDLTNRSVRAALGFHRTGRAVGLSGSEDDGVGFSEVRVSVLQGSPFAVQYVVFCLFISVKIVAGETVVLTLGFIPHRHMRFDIFLFHHPGQHGCRAVSGVAD